MKWIFDVKNVVSRAKFPGITYDAKGEGDLTITEFNSFLRGEVCETCYFGAICTMCVSAGIENNNFQACFGKAYVFPRRAPQASVTRFRTRFIGYTNNKSFPLRNLESIEIIHGVDVTQSADGPVLIVKAKCPDCKCRGGPCTQCGGDAEFHQDNEGNHFDGAIIDLRDASGEESVSVLARPMGLPKVDSGL
jgi:hypothetical protein